MDFEDKVQKYRLIFGVSLRDFLNGEAEKRQIPPKLYEIRQLNKTKQII